MKIYLISAILCLAGLAHGASIQRIARNTETIIPTIVEEILKVELQSDLKKNSAVEAIEEEPLVKKVEPTLDVEPIASRTVEEAVLPAAEEKKPEILEIIAVKEIIPEALPAVIKAEALPEIIEKVETIAIQENAEKPADNFRTESVPSVEQPIVEIVKETVVIEPVLELRQEPAAAVEIKEEEIVKPMSRNVVKEEIPQVEELRNILPAETIAVKETVPEPVAASNIVEPVVEVEQEVKNIIAAPILKEDAPALIAIMLEPETPIREAETPLEEPKAPLAKSEAPLKTEQPIMLAEAIIAPEIFPEMMAEELSGKIELPAPVIKEEKIETPAPAPIVQETKAAPESIPVPEIIAPLEAKPLLENAAPSVEESGPEIRQDRPTIAQQIQTALSNVPVVGTLISNLNNSPSSAVAADDSSTITDESATTARPNLIQQAITNTQNAWSSAVQAFNPQSTNAADGAEQPARPTGPLALFTNAIQTVANGVNSIVRPTDAPPKEEKPIKEEEKPVKEDEKPAKSDEAVKAVVSESQAEPEPIIAPKPEETQKVAEGEKENLVKN